MDGYNIIFAWDDLKEIARDNLDAARKILCDLLCNYQGYKKCEVILVFDAYKVKGGLGSAVTEYMAQNGYTPRIKVMGIPDSFVEHGTPEQLYRICGMDADSVLAAIMEFKEL